MKRQKKKLSGGFTLIELMVVVVIIGIVTALIIPEMTGTMQDELLRTTGREIIDTCNLAYSRAVSINQLRRVRLDPAQHRMVVEKEVQTNGSAEFILVDDVPNPITNIDPRISVHLQRGLPTPKDPNAPPETPNPEEANADGTNSLTFYPDGTAEAGEFLLHDPSGFSLRLRVNPITARVKIVPTEEAAPL